MQAVFLAAGRGTRLQPITFRTPKPLIKVKGKPLMQHNLEKLPEEIDEIIMVVNYLGEQIRDYFGGDFNGKKIKYIIQDKMLGTGHAVKICEPALKDKFLVMMGDDIYDQRDIKECLNFNNCILAKEVFGEFSGGRIKLNKNSLLKGIEEGAHNQRNGLVNTGLYVLSKDFFNYSLVKLEDKEEYGLPQTIVKMAVDIPVKIIKARSWIQINDLVGLNRAKKILERE